MNATRGFYGAYSIRFKIGENKRKKIAYLYNKDGEQWMNINGYSQMLFTYNDKGGLFKVGYANVNGERITTRNKDYETRFKYADDKKNIFPKEIANYGKDDSLMVDSTGIAKTVYTFDKQGRLIEAHHFGSDETPKEKKVSLSILSNILGSSNGGEIDSISAGVITKYAYDGNKSRPKKISFYGKDEQPLVVPGWGKIAAFILSYDENEMLVSIKALGNDDTAVPLSVNEFGDNIVEMRIAHDEYGNGTRFSFFGTNETMVISPKLNCAEVSFKHDDKRRITEVSFFGTGGDKINAKALSNDKYIHRVVYEYNDDDEIIVDTLYDKDDKEIEKIDKKNQSSAKPAGSKSTTHKGVITGTEVRMRIGPSTNDAVITYFYKGEMVDVLDSVPNWIKVRRSDGATGWVSSQFCSLK